MTIPAGVPTHLAAEGAPGPEGPEGPIVPIRSLAGDGDAEFVVYRAESPPATADRRFRAASVPLARTLRELVAAARSGGAAGPDAGARTATGALRAAVVDMRVLAESYDVGPAVHFFSRREAGAAVLDPRTLAALDAAAAGLIGEPAEAAPAATALAEAPAIDATPAPVFDAPVAAVPMVEVATDAEAARTPGADPAVADAFGDPVAADVEAPVEPPDGFRPPTGEALVALLETGISGLGAIGPLDLAPDGGAGRPGLPAAGANGAAAAPGDPDAVVPVETLVYRGGAALERARAVRDELRARPGPPDPALLAELYDLLDLAAAG